MVFLLFLLANSIVSSQSCTSVVARSVSQLLLVNLASRQANLVDHLSRTMQIPVSSFVEICSGMDNGEK